MIIPYIQVHIADGFHSDDWIPGYYLRPVFHCQRCYDHFVHSGDIDPTCQELSFPLLGPWFIVGPATVRFVLVSQSWTFLFCIAVLSDLGPTNVWGVETKGAHTVSINQNSNQLKVKSLNFCQ